MIEADERKTLLARAGLEIEDFEHLLTLVYEGAQEEVPWTRLLESLRCWLQANYVSLILRAPERSRPMQVVFAGEVRPTVVQPYVEELALMDPFPPLPRDRMLRLEDAIDEAAWLESEAYRNFHVEMNLRHHMGADLGRDNEPSCRVRVCRPHGAAPFAAAELALGELLLPHLQRAVQLRASLDIAEVERSCYDIMLDRLGVGVVMLDRRARVLRMNDAASQILAVGDGLQVLGGRLAATLAGENHALRQFIELAVNGASDNAAGESGDTVRGMALSRRGGRAALELAVRAAPHTQWSETAERPAVICIVRDPETRLLASAGQLRQLYGFTAAEAALAVELMRGCTVEDAAAELGVSRNTVRCQLRALFAKTGVTRQAELLRVLLSGIAALS